jgi:hypothetical protein
VLAAFLFGKSIAGIGATIPPADVNLQHGGDSAPTFQPRAI